MTVADDLEVPQPFDREVLISELMNQETKQPFESV
jgi:hypothetical protein